MGKWVWLFVAAGTIWAVVALAVGGNLIVAAVVGVLGLAYVGFLFPWRSRRLTQAGLMAMPDDERRVVVYWRPGCMYCAKLKATLRGVGYPVRYVNIWADSEAAAVVRSHNDGNETVPTVLLDDEVLTNPDPVQLRRRIEALAA